MKSQDPQNSADGTTKPKTYVKVYQLGKTTMVITFLFWIAYTIIFQIYEGWHWDPISLTEKILNSFANLCFNISFFMMFIPMLFKIDEILEEDVNN